MVAVTYFAIHPDPAKQGVRIDKVKYDTMRVSILDALKTYGSMTFAELGAVVDENLGGSFDGSVSWYFTTVKLDLEARGEIRRVPKSKPQMIEIV